MGTIKEAIFLAPSTNHVIACRFKVVDSNFPEELIQKAIEDPKRKLIG